MFSSSTPYRVVRCLNVNESVIIIIREETHRNILLILLKQKNVAYVAYSNYIRPFSTTAACRMPCKQNKGLVTWP